MFWKYDWCRISTEESIHRYRGTETFSPQNMMLRVFSVIFSLRKLYTELYVRLSLLLEQNPTQEKLYDHHRKQHIVLTPKNWTTLTENSFLCQPKRGWIYYLPIWSHNVQFVYFFYMCFSHSPYVLVRVPAYLGIRGSAESLFFSPKFFWVIYLT